MSRRTRPSSKRPQYSTFLPRVVSLAVAAVAAARGVAAQITDPPDPTPQPTPQPTPPPHRNPTNTSTEAHTFSESHTDSHDATSSHTVSPSALSPSSPDSGTGSGSDAHSGTPSHTPSHTKPTASDASVSRNHTASDDHTPSHSDTPLDSVTGAETFSPSKVDSASKGSVTDSASDPKSFSRTSTDVQQTPSDSALRTDTASGRPTDSQPLQRTFSETYTPTYVGTRSALHSATRSSLHSATHVAGASATELLPASHTDVHSRSLSLSSSDALSLPAVDGLRFDVSGEKILLIATGGGGDAGVTVSLTPQSGIGEFMLRMLVPTLQALGLSVDARLDATSRALVITGSVNDTNRAMALARFSLNNNKTVYQDSAVQLIAVQQSAGLTAGGTGHLKQFGGNQAPAFLQGRTAAITVNYGQRETINLLDYLTDPDGDKLVCASPQSLTAPCQLIGCILNCFFTAPGQLLANFTATDTYQDLPDFLQLNITAAYDPPSATPMPDQRCFVGIKCRWPVPPGTGLTGLTYTAFMNQQALPTASCAFTPPTPGINGSIDCLLSSVMNAQMRVQVTDTFGISASAHYLLTALASVMMVARQLEPLLMHANRNTTFTAPIGTVNDSQGLPVTYSFPSLANGQPLPGWIRGNGPLLRLTPGINELGFSGVVRMLANNGYATLPVDLFVQVFFGVPLVVNGTLPSYTITRNNFFRQSLPLIFSSPVDDAILLSAFCMLGNMLVPISELGLSLAQSPAEISGTLLSNFSATELACVLFGDNGLGSVVNATQNYVVEEEASSLSLGAILAGGVALLVVVMAVMCNVIGNFATFRSLYRKRWSVPNCLLSPLTNIPNPFLAASTAPFHAQSRGSREGSNILEYVYPEQKNLYIDVSRISGYAEQDWGTRVLAAVTKPISAYWYHRWTSLPLLHGLAYPAWLSSYTRNEHMVLRLDPSKIEIGDVDHILVILRTEAGRIIQRFTIDPQAVRKRYVGDKHTALVDLFEAGEAVALRSEGADHELVLVGSGRSLVRPETASAAVQTVADAAVQTEEKAFALPIQEKGDDDVERVPSISVEAPVDAPVALDFLDLSLSEEEGTPAPPSSDGDAHPPSAARQRRSEVTLTPGALVFVSDQVKEREESELLRACPPPRRASHLVAGGRRQPPIAPYFAAAPLAACSTANQKAFSPAGTACDFEL